MENSKNMSSLASALGNLKGNVFSYPIAVKQQHNIYLTGPIGEVEQHIDRIEMIRTAPPDDIIRLIINTPGGHVTTMISYMQAIKESKATVICHAEGQVASAGTFIWLCGHQHSIADYTEFMFHNMQYGSGGDAANVETQVKFYSEWAKELRESVYEGLLTKDELMIIANAGEVYLSTKQVSERLPAYYEFLEKKAAEEQEPCNCAECQMAEKLGYFSVDLMSGKTFNVPTNGEIPEEMLNEFTPDEWRDLARQLGLSVNKNASRDAIRKKINDFIKSKVEEEISKQS